MRLVVAHLARRQRIARWTMGVDPSMTNAAGGPDVIAEPYRMLLAAAHQAALKTVDRHVSAVLAKLGAPTRRDAVAKARELGLGTG